MSRKQKLKQVLMSVQFEMNLAQSMTSSRAVQKDCKIFQDLSFDECEKARTTHTQNAYKSRS